MPERRGRVDQDQADEYRLAEFVDPAGWQSEVVGHDPGDRHEEEECVEKVVRIARQRGEQSVRLVLADDPCDLLLVEKTDGIVDILITVAAISTGQFV